MACVYVSWEVRFDETGVLCNGTTHQIRSRVERKPLMLKDIDAPGISA